MQAKRLFQWTIMLRRGRFILEIFLWPLKAAATRLLPRDWFPRLVFWAHKWHKRKGALADRRPVRKTQA